jgi:hypothetical protein
VIPRGTGYGRGWTGVANPRVGRGGGDVVVAHCRRGADETIPVSTLLDVTGTCPDRSRTRRPLVAGTGVSPGIGDPVGGFVVPRAHAAGAFCSRTLAYGPAVGRGGARACQSHAEGRMRNREDSAAEEDK